MKIHKILSITSIISFLISSSTVFLVPLSDLSGKNGSATLGYVVGIVFWLFLIIGILTQIKLYKHQKSMANKSDTRRQKWNIFRMPALIAVIIFILSVIVNIVLTKLMLGGLVLTFFIFLSIFSFEMIFALASKVIIDIKNGVH